MAWIKRVGLMSVLILVAIQVIRPAKTNPSIQEDQTLQTTTDVRPEVMAIIDRSCNDCHSYKTVWPWYSDFAPISWYLVHDVNDGRRELNFSVWRKYTAKRAAHKLEEICSEVQKGNMPLKSYVLIHPEAKLSQGEVELLCNWTKETRARLISELKSGG